MARQPTKTIHDLHRDAMALTVRKRPQSSEDAVAIANEVKKLAEAAGYQRVVVREPLPGHVEVEIGPDGGTLSWDGKEWARPP